MLVEIVKPRFYIGISVLSNLMQLSNRDFYIVSTIKHHDDFPYAELRSPKLMSNGLLIML